MAAKIGKAFTDQPPETVPETPFVHVSVAAEAVHDNGNGTFTLRLRGREILHYEREMLEKLFPRLLESAYKLLTQETLLNSLATEAQLCAPATVKSYS